MVVGVGLIMFTVAMGGVSYAFGYWNHYNSALYSITKEVEEQLDRKIKYVSDFNKRSEMYRTLSYGIIVINVIVVMAVSPLIEKGIVFVFLFLCLMTLIYLFTALIGESVMGVPHTGNYSRSEERSMREEARVQAIVELIRKSYNSQHAELIISLMSLSNLNLNSSEMKVTPSSTGFSISSDVATLINLHVKYADDEYAVGSIESLLLEAKYATKLAYLLNILSNKEYMDFLSTEDGRYYQTSLSKDLDEINRNVDKVAREVKDVKAKTEINRIKMELDFMNQNSFDKIEDIESPKKETK